MTLIDNLIAVRTLLLLRGRARGYLVDDDGSVCLRKAMLLVSDGQEPNLGTFEDPAWKAFDDERDDRSWYAKYCDSGATDADMFYVLFQYLPESIKERFQGAGLDRLGCYDALAYFNDKVAESDDDVLDLFDKALADLGGMA